MTRPNAPLLAAGLLLAPVTPASAHSLLLAATPSTGATLSGPPAEIVLRFNNRIEKRLSTVRLVDSRGEARPAVLREGGPPEELRAAAPPLGPGTWRVQWRVLSVDGHVVAGGYTFRIAR